MLFSILAIVILILVVIVGAIIYAYKKLPRKIFILLACIIIGGPYIAFLLCEREFKLEAVPDALGVSSISYSSEDSAGFGPGAHASGIRLYPLKDKLALMIKERGMDFFKIKPTNQYQNSRNSLGEYSKWEETPVKPDQFEFSDKLSGNLDIKDFICNYGFCIDIDPAVHEQANTIVNSPGSFYSKGRNNMIFVSPGKNLVVFIYNH